MANIKISELNPLVTIQDADVLPIVDNAVTKKVTAAILRSYTEGNSVLLTGAQTVAGIKTFTAQLASSVATGTAPFSVASTTKVTNLNADLLDGLSSADFATLTGTQTLTNKTLTSPVINEILDSNGNEILGFTPIASATDYITIKNGIGVGVPVHISAAGSSANTGLHLEPKGTGLVQISDGTDATKGFRFRSSASAASAVTLLDAVSSAGRVITLPDATTTLVGTNTTDTLTNKSISGATNTLSNIGNASLTNSAITINGTSTSLGGSINVGTVTSVAALTLGTSGTDLTSTVANGTTTPVITLNVPTASASNRGALSSTDWSTFNAKQNAITLTTTGTSGAATLVGSTLNIPQYQSVLTNPITGTGTTNYLPKFTGASALGNSLLQEGTSAIGLGVTPLAWNASFKALQIGTKTALWDTGGATQLSYNAYNDGANKYLTTGAAMRYFMTDAGHTWSTAPSGTAGGALTFTAAMTLDTSGQLLIGTTTSSTFKLDVVGTARVSGNSTFGGSISASSSISTSGNFILDSSASAKLVIGSRSAGANFDIYNQFNILRINNTLVDVFTVTSGAASFNGTLTLGTGLALGAATATTGGIQFPATQVAIASANNLDDYEEGTWTMGISFGGASVGVTYGANTGNYTKIGRQVTVVGYLVIC